MDRRKLLLTSLAGSALATLSKISGFGAGGSGDASEKRGWGGGSADLHRKFRAQW
ncbi:MAG: hypothetical protein ACKVJU_13070 [Verrucomicrobiales bacterium]